MIWIVLCTGIFNIIMSLCTITKNTYSSFIFKIIPFFLGLGCLIYSLQILEVI